jgi:hypothetical protein
MAIPAWAWVDLVVRLCAIVPISLIWLMQANRERLITSALRHKDHKKEKRGTMRWITRRFVLAALVCHLVTSVDSTGMLLQTEGSMVVTANIMLNMTVVFNWWAVYCGLFTLLQSLWNIELFAKAKGRRAGAFSKRLKIVYFCFPTAATVGLVGLSTCNAINVSGAFNAASANTCHTGYWGIGGISAIAGGVMSLKVCLGLLKYIQESRSRSKGSTTQLDDAAKRLKLIIFLSQGGFWVVGIVHFVLGALLVAPDGQYPSGLHPGSISQQSQMRLAQHLDLAYANADQIDYNFFTWTGVYSVAPLVGMCVCVCVYVCMCVDTRLCVIELILDSHRHTIIFTYFFRTHIHIHSFSLSHKHTLANNRYVSWNCIHVDKQKQCPTCSCFGVSL